MNNDNVYYNALISTIGKKKVDRGYVKLIRFLYNATFRWSVNMDENRAGDGLWLRKVYKIDLNRPCSVLEALIGISKHVEQATSGDCHIDEAFWTMIDHLGMSDCTDDVFTTDEVLHHLDVFTDRKYRTDGSGGGLFPLKHPAQDQREVEIWSQMHAYIIENYD